MKNLKQLFPLAGVFLLGSFSLPAQAVEVVQTYDITATQYSNTTYVPTYWEFDESAVIQDLAEYGCTSLSLGAYDADWDEPNPNDDTPGAAVVVSLNSNNEVMGQTGGNGYWYNKSGEPCYWGDGSEWFVEYHGGSVWSVGNFPDITETNGACNIGFMYEDKVVLFNFTINIEEMPLTIVDTVDLSITLQKEDYEGIPLEFNLESVVSSLGCNDIIEAQVISIDNYGELVTAYTANNGFWYSADGSIANYATKPNWFIEYRPAEWDEGTEDWVIVQDNLNKWFLGTYYPASFPGSAVSKIGFYYGGKAVIFNINVTVEGSIEIKKTEETSGTITTTDGEDESQIQITVSDITGVLGCEYLPEAKFISMDSEGNLLPYTKDGNGFWFDINGQVCEYGNTAVWYVQYVGFIGWDEEKEEVYTADDGYFVIGCNPAIITAKGICKVGFFYNDKVVMFEVSVEINGTLNIEKTYTVDYTLTLGETGKIEFDAEEVITLLGCSNLAEAQVISILNGNTLVQTANNGYWYNSEGYVTTWGNNSAWYIEYRGNWPEEEQGEGYADSWILGTYQGVMEGAGVSNIGFYYDGKAVIFDINVTLEAPVSTKPEVVATVDLTFENEVSENYQAAPLAFDATKVLEALGCTSLTTEMLTTLDEDGMTIPLHTATNGYFFNEEGEVCQYNSEGSSWFVEYLGTESSDPVVSEFSIGNNAGVFNVSGDCNVGFLYEGKVYLFNISVILTEGTVDPDAGEVEVVKTIKLTYEQNAEGEAKTGVIPFTLTDVTSVLGEDMDALEVVSLNADDEVLVQTANNGYWYDNDGVVCKWGTEDMAYYIEYAEGAEFNIGFNGQDVDAVSNIGFMKDGQVVLFEVSVMLTVEPIEEVDVIKTYEFDFTVESQDDYATTSCYFDAEEVVELLGCVNLAQASVISLDAEGEVIYPTANNGFWYTAKGEVTTWGEDAAWFIEYNNNTSFLIGNYPDVENVSGVSSIGFYYKGKAVMFNITVKVTGKTSGINSIFNGNDDNLNIYNPQGVKITVKDLNELGNGIYIVNGKKVLVRK